MGIERRQHKRLDISVQITYRLLMDPGQKVVPELEGNNLGVTRNLSAGGLMFLSIKPISVGATLKVVMDLMDGGDSIACSAKVLRAGLVRDSGRYAIAVCFTDLPDDQKVRLAKFVDEQEL